MNRNLNGLRARRAGSRRWTVPPGRGARQCQGASRAQRGQSAVEYTVVCAALAFALGVGMVDDQSVLRMLLEAFRTAYEKFGYALSLPL